VRVAHPLGLIVKYEVDMKTITVEVTETIEVELDETKFTPEFMQEFKECMYVFNSIEDHAKHLAQLEARGFIGFREDVEGYGSLRDMGITFNTIDQCESISI